jgi:hypothetical protein
MPTRLPLLAGLSVLALPLAASDILVEPGERLAVLDTPHIHALVPFAEAEALRAQVARFEVIYLAMAKDAGYTITRPLNLLLDDDVDYHNGFSFVTPFPLIDIELAPALMPSGIFVGNGVVERTFTHELTHHMSNDREPNGFRRVMEQIFGRILPNDLLSDIVAYLTIPAHEFSPNFWHEGCAQWAETVYAPKGSVWGGRGRDSLTHMVWRLDAAEHAIPPVGEWRASYQAWPFGNRVYLYGIAYLRYLDGAYGGRATVWQLIEAQEHRWPFVFNGGTEGPLGKNHAQLLREARTALELEQQDALATLRTQKITVTKRLSEHDGVVGAPAWTADGTLFAPFTGIWGRPEYIRLGADGTSSSSGYTAFAMGDARSATDGTLVYAETPAADYFYEPTCIYLVTPRGHRVGLDTERTLEPDVRPLPAGLRQLPGGPDRLHYQVAAIQLLPASRQELMLMEVAVDDGLLWADADCAKPTVLPTQGRAWSPAFRPGHQQLCWVETDAGGSRLVLAGLPVRPGAPASPRSVLAEVRGRIIHPCWSADGAYVYLCADHSGVANAYRVMVDHPGQLVPVTNVIGGVVACVPSPDGTELAVVDYDRHGPYLARLPNDPATWPASVPQLDLPWPAPPGPPSAGQSRALPPPPPAAQRAGAAPGLPPELPGQPAAASGVPATTTVQVAPAAAAAPLPAAPGVPPPPPLPGAVAARQRPGQPAKPGFTPQLPDDLGDPAAVTVKPYHGIGEMRPLFWSPTTLAVPEGGYGITGLIADPIFSHELVGGAGAGPFKGSPVGFAGYVYGGQLIEIAALGWQAERDFNDQIVDSHGNEYDYVEDRRSAELRLGLGLAGYTRRYQAYVTAGIAEYQPVHTEAKTYQGQTLINLPPFIGVEQYVEATLAYADNLFFPTSYSPEDGTSFVVDYRHSGYGGILHGDRVIGAGTYVLSVWPEYGQELVVGGALGWSRGDHYLQGQFSVGGVYNVNQLPRGYLTTQAVGSYLAGGTVAWRTPLWRPFYGWGSTPFVDRQEVLELFFDDAKVSTDRLDGDSSWYRSVGAELHIDMMFWEAQLDPGVGVARQLDGDKKWAAFFQLAFLW